MSGKIESWVGEFLAIERRFQVQIDAIAPLGNCVCQSGLSNLARTEQRDSGKVGKAVLNQSLDPSRYHPCNYGTAFQICTVNGYLSCLLCFMSQAFLARTRYPTSLKPCVSSSAPSNSL